MAVSIVDAWMGRRLPLVVGALLASVASVGGSAPAQVSELGLVPAPARIVRGAGAIPVGGGVDVEAGRFADAALALRRDLVGLVGKKPLSTQGNGLAVRFVDDPARPAGGYRLTASPSGMVVEASDEDGAFWASRTLLQLLTEPNSSGDGVVLRRSLPALEIVDAPRFSWRGFMLDSSRHFQPPHEIKRWLDWMALHKLNVFHWHLVDSHGWRLPIPKYPRLVQQAGFREQPPVGRYGGWYTRDEIRDIVAYAAARRITVVPEIEMPGHSQAAVAAYPELLACDPAQIGQTAWFFGFPHTRQEFPPIPGADVICASNETTFQFLSDVIDETTALFPSPYIHVGGDEVDASVWKRCPRCSKLDEQGLRDHHQLQARFMGRIEAILRAKGRRLIGWDEIAEGGLSPTATVMSWRGVSGGTAAAKAGRFAVMSPEKPLYLDHGQGFSGLEPPHWPGRETLGEVHGYEPVPVGLTPQESARILGLQGNLWSIFANNDTLLQLQAFPRLCAISEVGWSPVNRPDFADFQRRLRLHRARLLAVGIVPWDEPPSVKLGDWKPDPALATGTTWKFAVPGGQLRPGDAQLWFRYSGGADALSIRGVHLLRQGKVVAQDTHPGLAGSEHKGNVYRLAVPSGGDTGGFEIHVDAFVERWARGGTGDTRGSMTLVQGDAKPVRTFAPVVRPPVQETTTPVPHNRDKAIYDWPTRHAQTKRLGPALAPDVVVIGDSIMHYWGGSPVAPIVRNQDAWERAFGTKAFNLGFGWDRTENVLYRIADGALDGLNPKVVVVAIGTNNLGRNTALEVADGVDAIVQEVGARLPEARILVLGILPRADQGRLKADVDRVNFLLQTRLHPRERVDVLDIGNTLRNRDGSLRSEWFSDGLHPNAAGYAAMATRIAPAVQALRDGI